MKKTFYARLLFLLLFQLSAFAQTGNVKPRLVDNAGTLTAAEKESLEQMLDSFSSSRNFDLVIVSEINSGSKSAAEFADDFFDYNGYGFGEGRDGCLFLNLTESRDMFFSTSGRGIDILTNAALDKLGDDTAASLQNGDNFGAYKIFINDWDEFLALDAKGVKYNFFTRWNLIAIAVSWLFAIAIGFIIVHVWKRGMNNISAQNRASGYMVSGGIAFNDKRDLFIFSTFTKTKRQSASSSRGGGGVRIGSSGRSHGGGGRKY